MHFQEPIKLSVVVTMEVELEIDIRSSKGLRMVWKIEELSSWLLEIVVAMPIVFLLVHSAKIFSQTGEIYFPFLY